MRIDMGGLTRIVLVACLATWFGNAAAQTACKLTKYAEWTVRNGPAHLLIVGAINDTPVGIVIDTGAARSLILGATATRLDLPRREARGVRFYGVGGEAKVEIAEVDHLVIDKVATPAISMYVASETIGEGADILLGQDFLSKFDIEFDLAEHKVRLFRAQDCKGVRLSYWTQDAPGEVVLQPITERDTKIAFDVSLNGKPVPAFLDSGAPTSLVSKLQAEAAGVVPGGEGVVDGRSIGGVGAKRLPSWVGTFKEFAIGNESIPDVRIAFADYLAYSTYSRTGSRIERSVTPTQPMIIGIDFLRSHRTFVVNSHQRMYFTYTGGPVFRVK